MTDLVNVEISLSGPSYENNPPKYEEAMGNDMIIRSKDEIKAEIVEEEMDAKILSVMRDVARKCTNPNPEKRPTAKEVLKMLEEVAPKDMLAEKFDISDDEADADDDPWTKKSMIKEETMKKKN